MAYLEVRDVTMSYTTELEASGRTATTGVPDIKNIIENVSLSLNKNELVCLLGASGVGKTTLFHIIAGLNTPDSGGVYLEGQEITGQPGRISYMLQKDLLLPHMTALENAALPLRIKGLKKDEAQEQVQAYFKDFGLSDSEGLYPYQLSGGMRQRLALLRTYMISREAALLDEPFSALDSLTRKTMQTWYLDMMDTLKLSTLFITHDIDEAIRLSDRIYLLGGRPGKIIAELTIEAPRPRGADFEMHPDFIAYKKQILELLQG